MEIYVDFESLTTEIPLTASDQTWVGAWWVGFVIAWVMSWACAFFVFCYPASLPSNPTTSNKLVPVRQGTGESYGSVNHLTPNNVDDPNRRTFSRSKSVFVQIPRSILTLLKNPTYMLISIGGAFDGMCISGLSTFLPKYIQVQYGYTAGVSALLFGIIVTPSGGLGTFSGGYVAKRFKLTRNQVLKMYIICQSVTIPTAFAMLLYCENGQIPGVNTPYNISSYKYTNSLPFEFSPTKKPIFKPNNGLSLNDTCNANCGGCGNLAEFMPVCGSDNRLYFNPCYAGCKNSTEINGTREYSGCSCVQEVKKAATMDSCDVGCNKFVYFAIFSFVVIWMSFMGSMASVVATLRFVQPEERSLGLGIQTIVFRYVYR